MTEEQAERLIFAVLQIAEAAERAAIAAEAANEQNRGVGVFRDCLLKVLGRRPEVK